MVAPAAAPRDQGMPADAIRLAPSAIVDWSGFRQPMVAATIFVPHGWVGEGGVVWGNQFQCTNGYAFQWSAKSTDGREAVALLPQQYWEWNQTGKPLKPGCAMARIDSVAAYIRHVLQQLQPGAEIVSSRERPDIAAKNPELSGRQDTGFQYIESEFRALDVTFRYTGDDGREMRGLLGAGVVFTYMRTGGGVYGQAVESWTALATPSFVAFAPAEKYNPPLYEGIRQSVEVDPRWQAAIAGHNLEMDRIAREGVMQRAEISRQTYESIRQMSQQAWENQQKSADLRAREFSEYIRDVETYADPQSNLGQVELDSSYKHAWRLDDGTYVLTNDHSFNPVQATGQFGAELGVAP
ncbi:MAG: hypothetical protein U5K56_17670 [Halioglobus sp.]|nr:hypothetical protein [Halioglobus sp.]